MLAVVLGAGIAAEVATYPGAQLPVAAVLAASTGLPMAVRRRLPLLGALLTVVTSQAVVTAAPDFQRQSLFLVAVFMLSLYSLGRHARSIVKTMLRAIPVVASPRPFSEARICLWAITPNTMPSGAAMKAKTRARMAVVFVRCPDGLGGAISVVGL